MKHKKTRVTQQFCLLLAMIGCTIWASLTVHSSNATNPVASNDKTGPIQTLTKADGAVEARLSDAYGKLPLSFEANQGQADRRFDFLSRGDGYSLYLKATEAVLVLKNSGQENQSAAPTLLSMKLRGANASARSIGLSELPTKSNYFIGNDSTRWKSNIPNYASVEYRKVYPGVDLLYYGNQRQLEYDFVVSPGADPGIISLAFDGAQKISINANGDLALEVGASEIRQKKPYVYQLVDGVKKEIASSYVIKGEDEVGFRIGAYDTHSPLVIDPVLVYSTYLGGRSGDSGRSIAVDASGNAYITGLTLSPNFPTVNPHQSKLNNSETALYGKSDVFIAKLNATGTALIYSTYLGGTSGDIGHGIAVDAAGNAYVTGTTGGTSGPNDFPTVNAYQATYTGVDDVFVAKLSPDGASLLYSTYIGAGVGHKIAVNATSGEAYVVGQTLSSNFPTTPGAFRSQMGFGDSSDGFVTKLSAQGSALVYSTYLGGNNGSDVAYDVAIDAAGNAYVTGGTNSSVFPVTPGAFQSTCTGCNLARGDAFIVKLNPQGSSLIYSTYLGGSLPDTARSIAIDASGSAYVTGFAQSTLTSTKPFPITPGAYNAGGGGFVTKLNPSGTALVYSAFIGGGEGRSIAVNATGRAYVTGSTRSTIFPTANALFNYLETPGVSDAFVTTLNPAGSALVFSTYLHGTHEGFDLVLDAAGNAFITGLTYGDLATTPGVFQPQLADSLLEDFGGDAFVMKVAIESNLPQTPPAPTNLVATAISGTQNNLTWVDNSNNEGGFIIERCQSNVCTATFEIARVGANVTSYTDTGLVPNQAYSYHVRAFNAVGISGYSNRAVATTTNENLAPLPPFGLTAAIMSSTQVRLQWVDQSNNETGFRVLRCQGTGCTNFTQIGQTSAGVMTYDDTNLGGSTTYRYAVRAFNGNGDSGFSNTAEITTLPTTPGPSTIALASAVYSVNEGVANTPQGYGSLTVTVTRSGNASAAATVEYLSDDNAGGAECNITSGQASQRCDYAMVRGVLRFTPGQISKTIRIPIINDGYAEGSEVFVLKLQNAVGASLGGVTQSTITIVDNETTAMSASNNPYLDNSFFVRMNYLDFLGREPDAGGWATWTGVLAGCGPQKGGLGAPPGCDRAHVSHGFFASQEFTDKGYLIYRMYELGMQRLPQYAEFIPDMASLSGQIGSTELQQNTDAFIQQFAARAEFTGKYGDVLSTAQATQFISRLEQTASVTLPSTAITLAGQPAQYGRQELIQKRASNQFSVGQTLKAFAEQKVVYDKYFERGVVSMMYFGYLRRDPDLGDPALAGWKEWVFVFTNGGAQRNRPDISARDYHHLVFGFIYSEEYRKRFGTP